MSTRTVQEQVLEFLETFSPGTIRPFSSPELPPRDEHDEYTKLCMMRFGLIEEEFGEYKDAVREIDVVEIADALADMIYVIYGAALTIGVDLESFIEDRDTNKNASLYEAFEDLASSIQQSNLDALIKALADMVESIEGIAERLKLNLKACIDEVHRSNMTKLDADGKPIFREDGKIMKSDLYEAPNLVKVIYGE